MNDSAPKIIIALRIPGLWSHPRELIERLPAGCRPTPETLVLPDGTEIGFGAMPADEQFAGIFHSSCRNPPTDEERAAVDRYRVNVMLSGPGGSLEAARTMMRAGAAILRAGGVGVFNDNGGVAHGATEWLELTDDGSADALTFTFVAIIRSRAEIWTMGMHVLGLNDIAMKREDVEVGGFDIVDVIRYLAEGEKPFGVGHVVADLGGPRFKAVAHPGYEKVRGSPMDNPFGWLRLVSVKDIAETN